MILEANFDRTLTDPGIFAARSADTGARLTRINCMAECLAITRTAAEIAVSHSATARFTKLETGRQRHFEYPW